MEIRKISAEDTLEIRHKVLWPDKPIEFCRLKDDTSGIHYGYYIEDELASVASVFINLKDARLRKFATLNEFQGMGLGTSLLEHIISDLKTAGIDRFWCDARVTATKFYRKFSMKESGESFLKSNLEYIVMERRL